MNCVRKFCHGHLFSSGNFPIRYLVPVKIFDSDIAGRHMNIFLDQFFLARKQLKLFLAMNCVRKFILGHLFSSGNFPIRYFVPVNIERLSNTQHRSFSYTIEGTFQMAAKSIGVDYLFNGQKNMCISVFKGHIQCQNCEFQCSDTVTKTGRISRSKT